MNCQGCCLPLILLLGGCQSLYVVYDLSQNNFLSQYSLDGSDLIEDVVGTSLRSETYLTAQIVEQLESKGGDSLVPRWRTLLRTRDLNSSVVEQRMLPFSCHSSQLWLSPNRKYLLFAKTICLEHPDRAIDSAYGGWICCPSCDPKYKGVNQRCRLFMCDLHDSSRVQITKVIDFPYGDPGFSPVWVDDFRFIISYAGRQQPWELNPPGYAALRAGYYMYDVRQPGLTKILLENSDVPYGLLSVDPLAKRLRRVHLGRTAIQHEVYGAPVVSPDGSLMVIADIKKGLLLYSLPDFKAVSQYPDIRYPYATFDIGNDIVAWGEDAWVRVGKDDVLHGRLCGMTILEYMGDSKFYCERKDWSNDRALFSRESRKYIVGENSHIEKILEYARWPCGRLSRNAFLFRWQ